MTACTLWNDDSGATAVEYGLMVAFIAVVIIGAVAALGLNVNKIFQNEELGTALGGP